MQGEERLPPPFPSQCRLMSSQKAARQAAKGGSQERELQQQILGPCGLEDTRILSSVP